jgi:hypothetical protein
MFTWKINKISVEKEAIVHAQYSCKLIQEPFEVETQGNWYFSDKIVKKPLNTVKELDIVAWIQKESMQNGVSAIELQLEDQMKSLQNEQSVALPWLPKTFRLRI